MILKSKPHGIALVRAMRPLALLAAEFACAACWAADSGRLDTTPSPEVTLSRLKAGWDKPARTYRPHTRWWWPGNALTKADITFQLEQMATQGFGGVEVMSTWKMYEKGNSEYLSPEFIELLKHAVAEARRLNLEVAITFGPGWSFGGPWVPKEDQSKSLAVASQDIEGGARYHGALPVAHAAKGPESEGDPGNVGLVAVVAGRILGEDKIDGDSLTVLTDRVDPSGSAIDWDVPAGRWRLMAFRLQYTGQQNQAQSSDPPAMIIDHMNQGAVQRYCDYLGGALEKAVGPEFGRTVDSFFCDSFEIRPRTPRSILWSTDTLAGFQKEVGYDLTRYLPSLWFDVGPLTPRLRYDLGSYLGHAGLRSVFKTFNDWCDAHHVQARIQPHYRFTEELVQGAGSTARPETEVTTARFEPVADPRKASASGARFYGRPIVSAESYTFIHPARYRTDLQDIKIATDAFLRDGVTQFYNHGYIASPEMHVAPTRDMPWANRISHWNTWWKYFHCTAEYVARSCYLMRQGGLVADVMLYSPQDTIWSETAIFGDDRRVMPYGNLAKTLVANGYDFDVVNDDLLQHHAVFREGHAEINGFARRILILPNATVVPIETMRAIRDFARAGGTVLALQALPSAAAGLNDHDAKDRELREVVDGLFDGKQGAVFLPQYLVSRIPFNPMRQPYSKTAPLAGPQRQLLAALDKVTPPDFALAGRIQSDGLTFIHNRVDDVDVYFVTNLSPERVATDITFRVKGKAPQRWDAITGSISPVTHYQSEGSATVVPIAFEPWESSFFVFAPGAPPAQPARSATSGTEVPAPISVAGIWQMKLEGYGFDPLETSVDTLASWTDSPRTRHFSGTGRYEVDFTVPAGAPLQAKRPVLDLGQVGNIAEVELNGQPLGISWMTPHRLAVGSALRPGKNHLVVLVTDTLINYVSGLETPPEVPEDLQPRLGGTNPHFKAGNATKEMKETDLPPSGLIGPVQIVFPPQT